MEQVKINSIDAFLAYFSGVQPAGHDKWKCLCPAHSDHDPSLTIELKEQKILIHCHTGCAPNAIVSAVGLTMADLFIGEHTGKRALNQPRKIVKEYSYRDLNDKEQFFVARFDPKGFAQGHRNGGNEIVWGLKGITPILYRLPELDKAIKAGDRIVVCYSPDTELLTQTGWVRFDKLPRNTPIAQWDHENIKFVVPSAYQIFDYKGAMVNIAANWCDLLVTPDHRILAHSQNCIPKIFTAENIKRGKILPVSGYLQSDSITPTIEQVKLIAAWLNDGYKPPRGKYNFNLKKDRKKRRLRELLTTLNVNFKESNYPSCPEWTQFWIDRDNVKFLDQFVPNKEWNWEMLNWTLEARRTLVKEIAFWDGDHNGRNGIRFFTANKKAAEIMSAITVTSGYGSILRLDSRRNSTNYVLNIKSSTERCLAHDPTFKAYDGKVYCCSVPSGLLVTRRNGKTTIAGNCEGEKDVDSLYKAGMKATTNPMGASKWRPQYTESLKSAREVVIIPDRDKAGRDHAQLVARALYEAQVPVKIAEIPETSVKDITEWIEAGATVTDIEKMLNAPPAWTPATKPPADVPDHYNFTDLGNAERLIARYGNDIKYCPERGLWLVWRGTVWQWDHGTYIKYLAQRTVRAIYEEAALEANDELRKQVLAWAKSSEGNGRITAMISQAEPLATIELDQLDADPMLLGCLNGTLDLKTGSLRPPVREEYITQLAPVNYDPAASCPLWLQFIEKITAGNKQISGYLQRSIGYSLTGNTSEQSFFYAHGGGQNGKSTFLNTFMFILGPYAAQADSEMFCQQFRTQSGGHSEDIANLAGKRLVVGTELPENRRMAIPKIKQMTGGERVRASHKYEREFEYTVTYKVWLNANHKLEIADTTYSIWRRVKLIPFTVKITEAERDLKLADKLRPEYPAILAWAVQGCLDWQASGLMEPLEVKAATADYRVEQDILAEFLSAKCIIENNAESVVSHKDLYTAYNDWSTANSIESVPSKLFSKRLGEKAGIVKFTGHGQIKWRFIRLRRPDDPDETSENLQLFTDNPVDQNNVSVDRVDKVGPFTQSVSARGSTAQSLRKRLGFIYPEANSHLPDGLRVDENIDSLEQSERMGMLVDGCELFTPQILEVWKAAGRPEIYCVDGRITDLELYLQDGPDNLDHVGAIVEAIRAIK